MATNDIAIERVEALLKIDTGSGSLYSHLAKVVESLATNKTGDALDQIETLSRHLKQATFNGVTGPDENADIVIDAAAEEKRSRWCSEALKLVRPPSDPLSSPEVLCAVQNFMEDAAMFEWAGVGFGKQESFHIAMTLRKLAADTPSLETLRLWGKILGTEGDYYVAEGRLQAISDTRKPALPGTPEDDVEPRGEGTNAYSYWVSKGGSAPWIRLPSARASHIVAAKKVKRMITGDLSSQVLTMPSFPGTEQHLLRSQIARITGTCTLSVAGYLEDKSAELDPPSKKLKDMLEPALEFAFPGHDELAEQKGWVHASPIIWNTGKTSWPDLDALKTAYPDLGEDAEAAIEKQITTDKAKEEGADEKGLLESIENDLTFLKDENDAAEGSPAWSIKVHGDKGLYDIGGATKSYRVTAVRSLIWPGAVTVCQGSKFANIYIGNGLKCGTLVPKRVTGEPLAGTSPFLPLVPDKIMEEPTDLTEHPEPNPDDADAQSDKGSQDPEEEGDA